MVDVICVGGVFWLFEGVVVFEVNGECCLFYVIDGWCYFGLVELFDVVVWFVVDVVVSVFEFFIYCLL